MAEPKKAAKTSKSPPPAPAPADARKVPKGGSAGKHQGFKIAGRRWLNPETGQEEILPPIDDFVADFYESMPRWMLVQETQKRYGCGVRTVDSAIARVKADFEQLLLARRGQRVSKLFARLDNIYHRGLRKASTLGVARAAVMDQAKLAGDLITKPEEAPATTTEDMTDAQLTEIAAREKRADAGPGGGGAAKKKARKKKPR